MLRQLVVFAALLGALSSTSCVAGDNRNSMDIKSSHDMIKQHTNIKLVGADDAVAMQQEQPHVLVDPSNLYDKASEDFRKTDIEEDPFDRFVTTRSGKPRVRLVEESENWAEESPLIPNSNDAGRTLIRKKRCGGGGGDDDGDANRARRRRAMARRRVQRRQVRRQRRRERKAARRAARTKTTTITRTILPANQVATYQGQAVVPAAATSQVYVQQPGVVQTIQSQPRVQTIETVQQPGQVHLMAQPQSQFQVQAQTIAGISQPLAMGGAVSSAVAAAA